MHVAIKWPLSPLMSHGALLIILERMAWLDIMLSLSLLMGAKVQSFKNSNGGIRERWVKRRSGEKEQRQNWRQHPDTASHIHSFIDNITFFVAHVPLNTQKYACTQIWHQAVIYSIQAELMNACAITASSLREVTQGSGGVGIFQRASALR